jgi:hypothetical protein
MFLYYDYGNPPALEWKTIEEGIAAPMAHDSSDERN